MRINTVSGYFCAALITLGIGVSACDWVLGIEDVKVLPAKDDPPAGWEGPWSDAILYFILVDRFHNGDTSNDGTAKVTEGGSPVENYWGGDWQGVINKIKEGYFQDLGVNTLWLSVPVKNTDAIEPQDESTPEHWSSSYHSYWPSDVYEPEKHFGTKDKFEELVKTAHKEGLRVIVDYVPNHVHTSSPVYIDHPEWFSAKECLCGKTCSWEDEDERFQCWLTPFLADFNFSKPGALDFSLGSAVYWANTGIDGYNIVAAKHIEPKWIWHFREKLEKEMGQNGEQFLALGQSYSDKWSEIKKDVNPGEAFDGKQDFPLRTAIVATVLRHSRKTEVDGVEKVTETSMEELANVLNNRTDLPSSWSMCNFLSNPDMPRIIHHAENRWNNEWVMQTPETWEKDLELPGDPEPFERLMNAYTVLFTLPGMPAIYYGDEIAMPGAGDPDNRRPMIWKEFYEPNQEKVLSHVKTVAKIRSQRAVLRGGRLEVLGVTEDAITYSRYYSGDKDNTLYVVVNRGDTPLQIAPCLPDDSYAPCLLRGHYEDLISKESVSVPGAVELKPRSSMILVKTAAALSDPPHEPEGCITKPGARRRV